MYNVTVDEIVTDRLAAMPHDLMAAFGGILGQLCVDPWGQTSSSYSDDPRDAMRSMPFGNGGLVIYMVNETKRLVVVFDVIAL